MAWMKALAARAPAAAPPLRSRPAAGDEEDEDTRTNFMSAGCSAAARHDRHTRALAVRSGAGSRNRITQSPTAGRVVNRPAQRCVRACARASACRSTSGFSHCASLVSLL